MEQGDRVAGCYAGCHRAPLHIAHAVVVWVNCQIVRGGRAPIVRILDRGLRATLQLLMHERTRASPLAVGPLGDATMQRP